MASALSVAFAACGVISTLSSACVVVTAFTFPSMMLSSSRPFSHALFIISLCDLLSSIGSAMGFPTDPNSPECKTQGILLVIFTPSSYVWTAMLVYQLRCVMLYNVPNFRILTMHFICWPIPVLGALLPLTTNTYGHDDETVGLTPCIFSGDHRTRTLWTCVFFAYSLLFVVVMTAFLVSAYRSFRTSDLLPNSKKYAIFKATILYPICYCVLSFPFMGYFIYFNVRAQKPNHVLLTILEIVFRQFGTVMAIIFFTQSAEARERWRRLLCGVDVSLEAQEALLAELYQTYGQDSFQFSVRYASTHKSGSHKSGSHKSGLSELEVTNSG